MASSFRDAVISVSLHSLSTPFVEWYIWGSTHSRMFLGGFFSLRHISINVLWWLAFANLMREAFSCLPFSS